MGTISNLFAWHRHQEKLRDKELSQFEQKIISYLERSFTLQEISDFKSHFRWLRALADGTLQPRTAAQKSFVKFAYLQREVAHLHAVPSGKLLYERMWCKFKAIERELYKHQYELGKTDYSQVQLDLISELNEHFSDDEVVKFKQYYFWLTALADKSLQPVSESQQQFLMVDSKQAPPQTTLEIMWRKFCGLRDNKMERDRREDAQYQQSQETLKNKSWKTIQAWDFN